MFPLCSRYTQKQEAKTDYGKQGQESLRIVSGGVKLNIIASFRSSFIEI